MLHFTKECPKCRANNIVICPGLCLSIVDCCNVITVVAGGLKGHSAFLFWVDIPRRHDCLNSKMTWLQSFESLRTVGAWWHYVPSQKAWMFITVAIRAISVPLSHLNPLQALSLVLNCPFYYNSPLIRRSKGHFPLALYIFMCMCVEWNVYGHVWLTGLLVYNYWIHAEHTGCSVSERVGPNSLHDPAGPTSQQDLFLY